MVNLTAARKATYAAVLILAVLLALEGAARLLPEAKRPDLSTVAFDQVAVGNLYVPDADLFWRLRPGLATFFNGNRLRTSSLGFRGPEPGDPKVLCLGDSVAFGYSVEEPEAWPHLLARASGLEVLDAGVPGYSTYQGRVLLAQLLVRFRPRVVALSFGYNDAHLFPFADTAAAHGLGARLVRRLRRSAAFRQLAALAGEGRAVRAARELLEIRGRNHGSFPFHGDEDLTRFRAGETRIREILAGSPERVALPAYAENLAAMVRMAVGHGAAVLLVETPYAVSTREPYFAASRIGTPIARYRQAMREVAVAEGATLVELPRLHERVEADPTLFVTRPLGEMERASFARLAIDPGRRREMGLGPDLRYRVDVVHPSAGGHAYIAAEVARAMAGLGRGIGSAERGSAPAGEREQAEHER